MTLGTIGFATISLPPASPAILASYDALPVDEYMGHGTRYKKFSQYRLSPAGADSWNFSLLPHRDYTAFKEFNPVGGGIRRSYLPVEVDFTPMLEIGVRHLGLDRGEDWQVNLHQNRTRAQEGRPGPLTPEGVHHDGHEFVMIAVLRREHVGGGETRLWHPGEPAPLWTCTLQPGQAVLLDDRALAHDVTDLVSADGQPGWRDIFIAAFSRWAEKWYGDEHDAAALAADAGNQDAGDQEGAARD
jgi:hypothetical protein